MRRGINIVLILTLVLLVVSMSACKKNNHKDGNSKDIVEPDIVKEEVVEDKKDTSAALVKDGELALNSLVVKIGSLEVGYDEVSFYLRELKDKYQSTFGNEIWEFELEDGKLFKDLAKEEALNQVIQLKIIGLKAADEGIELVEEENIEIMKSVEEDLSSTTDDFKEENGITKELLMKTYADNYLATKVYEIKTNNVGTDIAEDEVKQITIQQIVIKTNSLDSKGNKIELTAKEKEAALTKAKKLLKTAKTVDDFYEFAVGKTENVDVEYTFGKGEMDESVEKAAFDLKSGQFSKVIESKEGYHIIYCVNDNDEAATAEVKESIIEGRQEVAFKELYDTWQKDYKVVVNNTIWDQVSIVE